MIKFVTKRNGQKEPFSAEKLNRWAEYATAVGGNWSEIAQKTFKRLQDGCSTADIHDTMIDVCLSKESITYSRVAARLLSATVKKNLEAIGIDDRQSFHQIAGKLNSLALWSNLEIPEKADEWYDSLKKINFEFWQIKQWLDKYSVKHNGIPVESPAIGYLGIAIALYGDSDETYKFAEALCLGKINLPTPALNGLRNGDFDTISCCVISSSDTTDSIGVANHIAYKMTAKKAGIGIEYTTRSKGDSVKGGRVEHLGKWPILKTLDREVKTLTQITRGGNATATVLVIDPEIESILMWKTQRIDIEQRIDKLDYELGYNDAFLNAVIKDEPWYLFSLADAPEIYDNFYTASAERYNELVRNCLAIGVKHKEISARKLLQTFLTVRQETGRFYDHNLTRSNTHTPFIDVIRQSNLCVAPETEILTRYGNKVISTLEGQTVEIWNGEEFSEVLVSKTGENQELMKVFVLVGAEIKKLIATPYHKWYLFDGTMVRTSELKEMDKLELWTDVDGKLVRSAVLDVEATENNDTYCVNEPKRHRAVFNGILTGQCEEIMLPTKGYKDMPDLYSAKSEGETAFCSLSAINVHKTSPDEYEEIAYLALKAVDIMIDAAPMMSESMKESIMRRRSAGIGITGLASAMYKAGLDYDGSEESLSFVSDIAERHYYYLLKASQSLSADSGVSVVGIKESWLPVDTAINASPKLDWEVLRGHPRKHSVLVAHMPTESSSLLSGSTNGLYPARARVINKRSRKGLVQFICEDFIDGKTKTAFDVDNINLSKYYGAVQNFTDQGISCDFYVTPSKFEGGKVSMAQLMKEWVAHAKLGNKTKYYLNTNDNNGGSFQDTKKSEEDGCESCKL